MKLCTAVQEGCDYKDTLRVHRYYAPLAKYFTVCITYQPTYVLMHVIQYFQINKMKKWLLKRSNAKQLQSPSSPQNKSALTVQHAF